MLQLTDGTLPWENAVDGMSVEDVLPAIGVRWQQTCKDSVELELGVDVLLLELLVGRHVHAC